MVAALGDGQVMNNEQSSSNAEVKGQSGPTSTPDNLSESDGSEIVNRAPMAVEKPQRPPKSNARISGMVATVALLVMFALLGVVIWIGG